MKSGGRFFRRVSVLLNKVRRVYYFITNSTLSENMKMLRYTNELYLRSIKNISKKKENKIIQFTLVLFDELIMQRCTAGHLIKTYSTQRVQGGRKSRRVTKQKKDTHTHTLTIKFNKSGGRATSFKSDTRLQKSEIYIFIHGPLFTPHATLRNSYAEKFHKIHHTPLIILSFFSILI